MSIHVFAGPTLPADAVRAIVPEAVVHPPVAHGDLPRLAAGPGDVVVIIDGYYHQTGAVRHKEILGSLAAGARVVGCSSMGALRAAELHPFGMAGSGVVFAMYRDGVLDADDEVALAHGEAPEYRPFSEPLVNIRHAVAAAGRAGAIDAGEAAACVDLARALPYQSRSWRAVERCAEGDSRLTAESFRNIRSFLAAHPEHADVKAADAQATLGNLAGLATTAGSGWAAGSWRNRACYAWEAEFTGGTVENRPVSRAAVLRYLQVHHPAFPGRWRAVVLAAIAGDGRPSRSRALEVAAGHGLTARSLTAAQKSAWLTPREIREFDEAPDESLVRVLVRSYRPPRGVWDLVRAMPDLADDPEARRAVAESSAINDEVATWRTGWSTTRLGSAPLTAHLGVLWGVPAQDAPSLLAAARDRGFASVGEALSALRPHFLRSRFRAAEAASARAGVNRP
ncbi:TfuA-like protein [Streptomyces sp. UNOC14_S4]|uniref:TfuA-like protein n=1 Tax=Streptomyces sp. UNOC14_S4 TaxID=2872340 RepID=UPI001E5389A4|nr:TfuA-like protein [Streptomyces sp. UNOC14_S4]MCC3768800.1 hypothetical protein [Streptomyces sp. UNOC14_S4]